MKKILFGIIMFNTSLFSAIAFADVLTTVDKALEKIYGKGVSYEKQELDLSAGQAARIEEEAGITFAGTHSTDVIIHTARKGDEIVGHAFEDVVMGKWGLIYYVAGLDAEGKVKEIVIVDYQEIRGKPVAKKRFLRQYKDKTLDDPVNLYKDIDGVSGATISSRSMTDGVRKILHLHKMLIKE